MRNGKFIMHKGAKKRKVRTLSLVLSAFHDFFCTFLPLFFCAFVLAFFFVNTVEAQYKHEFSVHGAGGLATLQYNVNNGVRHNSFGGNMGLSYTFFIKHGIGINTGVEIAMYNSKFKLDSLYLFYTTNDYEGAEFEFRSAITDLKEKQTVMMLQIPLMLQFQTQGEKMWFFSVGGKIGLPVNGSYKTVATLKNSGYYEFENYEYTTQRFMGFGLFKDYKSNGILDFNHAFFIAAEIGRKRRLNDNGLLLYTGLYIDYGLTNTGFKKSNNSNTEMPLFTKDLQINSAFNADFIPDAITPIAAGIKLKLSYGTVETKQMKYKKKNTTGCDCNNCKFCICLIKKKSPQQIRKNSSKTLTKQKKGVVQYKNRKKR